MLAIYPTPEDVAEAVADKVVATVAGSARTTVGLAGGSTPSAAYRRLAERPVDWSRTTLWLGDERWVPHDHPEANSGMARQTLGERAATQLLAPDFDLGDAARAAAAYEAELRAAFAAADEQGRPGLVLLGMGDDGHTASLFPGTDALEVTDRSYVANWVGDKGTWRLTATLPLLWAAREVVFIVTGEAKAAMLARIIEGHEPFPAQRVAAGNTNTSWFLDEAAASQLRKTPR